MVNFKKLRFDSAHHLGLGDIRLTLGQQQEIEQIVGDLLAALEDMVACVTPLRKENARAIISKTRDKSWNRS